VVTVSGTLLSTAVHDLMPIADVLILCMSVDADLLPVLDARRRYYKTTVFESNDHFLGLQPHSPTAAFIGHPEVRSMSFQMAALCDGIQVTSEYLGGILDPTKSGCAVFANHLWDAPTLIDKGEGLRIGWAGSLGHMEDVKWVLPALCRVLARHPEVELWVMAPEPMAQSVQATMPDRITIRSPGSLADYFEFLQSLHIGLCPLLDTEFNRGRSDTRFLEYASRGVASLCSDLDPYRASVKPDRTGVLFSGLADFERQLERLIANPALRQHIAGGAHAYVHDRRLERHHAGERLAYYQSLGACSRVPDAGAHIRRLGLQRVYADADYFAQPSGSVEESMINGLLEQAANPERAAQLFWKAAEAVPSFYLPYLHAGRCDPDPQRAKHALHQALRLNRHSCTASLALGLSFWRAGNNAAAQAHFDRAACVAPRYATAWEWLGVVALDSGDVERAMRCWSRALAESPLYTPPRTRLAREALERGNPVIAIELLEPRETPIELSWRDRFLLGRAYNAMGRPRDAIANLEAALIDDEHCGPVLAELARGHLALGDRSAAKRLLARAWVADRRRACA
jgi:tetratricopeptide (TPR) repeat protein